jgi:ribonuclease-3
LAFIHKSAARVDGKGLPLNNERLEYLGDAVLGSVIAEHLYIKYPDEKEGFLTKMRSKIVNGEHLCELAKKMHLNELIIKKVRNEQANKHILGDTVEAFIGAIYLDRGYRRTGRFIREKVLKSYIDIEKLEKSETNYKSLLIEWAQRFKKDVTFYTDIEPYDPTRFISYVSIGDTLFGSGSGVSKKEAEQSAAFETLEELEISTDG